jgi:hypothetical protein
MLASWLFASNTRAAPPPASTRSQSLFSKYIVLLTGLSQ